MRSVAYRYVDLRHFHEVLKTSKGQSLRAPEGIAVRDGEWLLALFEFERTSRATAAAGRGVQHDDGMALVFERRDWERLLTFAAARASEGSSMNLPAMREVPAPEPQRAPAVPERPAPPPQAESLRRTQSWEAPARPGEMRFETPLPAPTPSAAPISVPLEDPTIRQSRKSMGLDSRILLVDDDEDLREVISAMLEAVGLVVDTVGSAEEALEEIHREAPDLLVLDWNLPGMNGLELCKKVRADARAKRLPVLFLTAHSATQDMVEAFAAGADDYVVKPFRAAELGARIFGLLRRTKP